MDWTPEAVIEELRNWEDKFYSESETKLLMEKAAGLIEKRLSEACADKLIDEILKFFEDADIEINTKLTLFAKVQNAIYKCVK